MVVWYIRSGAESGGVPLRGGFVGCFWPQHQSGWGKRKVGDREVLDIKPDISGQRSLAPKSITNVMAHLREQF